eukprot:965341-Amorphochlora_amoeboformis.AAC.1
MARHSCGRWGFKDVQIFVGEEGLRLRSSLAPAGGVMVVFALEPALRIGISRTARRDSKDLAYPEYPDTREEALKCLRVRLVTTRSGRGHTCELDRVGAGNVIVGLRRVKFIASRGMD